MARKNKLKKEKKEKVEHDYTFVMIVFFAALALFAIVYASLSSFPIQKTKIEYVEVGPRFISMSNATLVSMHLPAVDSEGEGVITTLTVEATPGSGRILLDINNLLFWADTEHSIRVARSVAKNITGLDLEKYDLIYNIYANASIIGGESAGAALVIATISAVQNKTINKSVIITGKINHDGTIGPVLGILPKAQAARDVANATLLLVPLLQSRDVTYETRKHCEKFGVTEICTIEQIPKKIKVSEMVGIEVREVENIQEALEYFIS